MGQKNTIRHRVPQVRRGTETKSADPYLSKKGLKEPAKCTGCKSVYHHKKWYSKEDPIAMELQKTPMQMTLCPACRKTLEHFPAGLVTLRGGFLTAHKDQILHLIRNEEARAKGVNPLERIISIKDLGDSVEIQTTGERFAQRIGKDVKKVFKGEVSYNWVSGDKRIKVEWHRQGEEEKIRGR
ncbi:MAG: BCAM0308 family protein [Nitrospiria bacterium]